MLQRLHLVQHATYTELRELIDGAFDRPVAHHSSLYRDVGRRMSGGQRSEQTRQIGEFAASGSGKSVYESRVLAVCRETVTTQGEGATDDDGVEPRVV